MTNQQAVARTKPSTIAESGSSRFASAVAGIVTTMIVIASTVSMISKRRELQEVLHVEGQGVEDVPEHRPEAREDDEEEDEAEVPEHEHHVGEDLRHRPRRRRVRRPRRLLVEEGGRQ